jgi:hypothetical protein
MVIFGGTKHPVLKLVQLCLNTATGLFLPGFTRIFRSKIAHTGLAHLASH